jgi:L-iditol 2-dehydrogenase
VRAAVLYGKEDVRVEEVAEQPLNPGEVRIAIQAALTCGTDLKVFRRGYHAKMIVPPAVFGHELAGLISEIHPETQGWSKGQRVVVANSAPCGECFYCQHGQENLCDDLLFLNGAYAESMVVPARIVEKNLIGLRPGTSFVDAALTEPLACVVQGVGDLCVKGKERVLVIGSGPIGLMFAAVLKQAGCNVTVAGRGENRLALARRLEASIIAINPRDDLYNTVKESGRTFDVVVEAVGRPQVWETAVRLVRKGGAVNFFGGCPADTFVHFDTALIHYSNLRLLASFHHTPQTIRQALACIEAGVITARDFVDGSCRLEELPEVLRGMAAGNRVIKTWVKASA